MAGGRTSSPVIVTATCTEGLSDNYWEGGDSLVARVTFFPSVKIKTVKMHCMWPCACGLG